MRDNGINIATEVVEACKYGLMGPFMRGTGKTIKPSLGVGIFILTVMFIVVSGSSTKLTATGSQILQMAPSLRSTGMKMNGLAQVEKNGLMVPAMRVVTSWVKSMVMGPLFSQMVISM